MADIAAVNWNEVDASNTTAAPEGAPEGMAPSGVNNTLRAHQGAIKRNWKRNSVMVTTGSAGAYIVTHTVPPTAYADGECELVSFHAANTAGATLNVGGLGDKPLHYYSFGAWRLVPPSLIGAEQTLRVAYHASSAAYRLIDLPDRTGEVVAFGGPDTGSLPAGMLLCYGQAVSRTAYVGLFTAIGGMFGVGDGSSTFNLPDLRGRVAAGLGNMGGSESGRLNGEVGSVMGAAGGVQSRAFGVSGSISGSGTISGYASVNVVSSVQSDMQGDVAFGGGGTFSGIHTHNISYAAPLNGSCTITSGSISGGATDTRGIVQPTMALNYVIRI